MEDYSRILDEQIYELAMLIEKVEKRLDASKKVEMQQVRAMRHRNGFQYHLVNSDGERKYVRKKDVDSVRDVLQREYDLKVYDELLKLRRQACRFAGEYDFTRISGLYEEMSPGRKALVTPIIMTDAEYLGRWMKKYKSNMNTLPKKQEYQTEKGDLVRSKSEKILADIFYKCGVPYSYEPEITFPDGTSVCPDFVLLNQRRRKTYLWEHFGMLGDSGYAEKSWSKLMFYERMGFCPGENFLYTMESDKNPLSVKKVKDMVERYLV